MTGQIMQHRLINAIEVMSEEIDGVIDEFQGEVRCKCLKVLTTLDFNVTNSVHTDSVFVRNYPRRDQGNEGEN